ncbi:MAG: CoA-binding protein, partial [Candidatus Bathyarchaeota archaeon]|nr:CoA-binding protein [Candidatus Bathyarchaeota archaeon]
MGILEDFRKLFYPKSVAVIGASNNPLKMGFQCVKSLVESGFQGKIYPVNPTIDKILNLKCYPSILSIPDNVELAIITIPVTGILQAFKECALKGVGGAVIITGGFKETGREEGLKLQEELKRIADDAGIKVIGPNTFGMVNLHANLNASFTIPFSYLKRGRVAIVGQSGGVCHILAFRLHDEEIGFSKIVGVGNRCNVEFADLLEYLSEDPETEVIALYVEGVEDARRLIEVAKDVVKKKPIIVYKVGVEESGKAVYSHTGSLAGKSEIYSSAFKQAGMVPVEDCVEFVDTIKAFCLQKPPKGKKFAVVSKEAGPSIITIDTCVKGGLTLAGFSEKTIRKIEEVVPPYTIRSNPVDLAFILADYEKHVKVLKLVLSDENVNSMIYINIYNPDLKLPVEEISRLAKENDKTVVACLIGFKDVQALGKKEFEKYNIPVYP